ncbi:sulfatase-like hydrolase/transferase [Rubinisphaera margarita]|uniref:sulfatase-like hydrolase/transferase n=1 Tax=Rubinisphaera margarita TaxID=2909586 RepID=UPI001EE9559E|nr:sulfatase-like hydrolase/transferase [Rubinisphaera margarita]MCG6155812.1 sulfatase-like hydrolase/transferase [Rubinisphaera margarita]
MRYSLSLLTLLFGLCLHSTTQAAPPNMILVFIDDMGWGDFSCFGNTDIETENIDALAAEGIRFEQFYVNSPICSPSRCAISTGQYPQRWRINSYLAHRKLNEDRGVANWLDPEAPMLSDMLHDAGYATGHFGKWHLGGQRDVGEAPLITEYGFDKSLTNFEGLGPRVLAICDAHDGSPLRRHTLGSDQLGRGEIIWEDRSLVTQSFTQAALDFVKKNEKADKPFYINVWPDDVHGPYYPPEARRGDGSRRELYLGVLDTMDEQLGELFDYVKSQPELKDNTLILVCSDNGPDQDAGSAGPFRGMKTMLYEGGVRSPLVAWGPGLLAKEARGSVNTDSVFSAIDLVPSLLEISGVEKPDDVMFDGENLAGTLLGKSENSRQQPLYFRRPPDRDGYYGQADLPDLSMRDGDWKLLCEYDGSDPQLYDLASDRGETKNVAEQHPKIVKEMTKAVVDWNNSMPPDNGDTWQPPKPKRKPAKSKS